MTENKASVHALCSSYYHVIQVLSFSKILKQSGIKPYIYLYTTPFLGKSRVERNRIDFEKAGLSGEVIPVDRSGSSSLIKCLIFAFRSGVKVESFSKSYVLNADSINIWFTTYLYNKGIDGKLSTFEDGIGTSGSLVYRARAKSRLENRFIVKFIIVEVYRYLLTLFATRSSPRFHLIRNSSYSKENSIDLKDATKSVLISNALVFPMFKPIGPTVIFVSQPISLISDIDQCTYERSILQARDWAHNNGYTFAIKSHPNEDLGVRFNQHLIEYDGPLESLVSSIDTKKSIILMGTISTALISCSCLFGIPAYRVSAEGLDDIYGYLDSGTYRLLLEHTKVIRF